MFCVQIELHGSDSKWLPYDFKHSLALVGKYVNNLRQAHDASILRAENAALALDATIKEQK
jgi:hypothetical protein